jgi:hypothetical protein
MGTLAVNQHPERVYLHLAKLVSHSSGLQSKVHLKLAMWLQIVVVQYFMM